ncbi:hypothetical protein FQA39_LY01528 [Lamprigera yunnana]|nr:hypothetical protein FQA39_LY01528 [Lamprigera yunnana]
MFLKSNVIVYYVVLNLLLNVFANAQTASQKQSSPKSTTKKLNNYQLEEELQKAVNTYVQILTDAVANDKEIQDFAVSVLQISNEMADVLKKQIQN